MLCVCEHAYACVLSSDKITAGDGLTTGYILFRLLQRLEREISLLSLKHEWMPSFQQSVNCHNSPEKQQQL